MIFSHRPFSYAGLVIKVLVLPCLLLAKRGDEVVFFAAAWTGPFLSTSSRPYSQCFLSTTTTDDRARTDLYAAARRLRIEQGPPAALAAYQQLLQRYPDDCTTATRLAASSAALSRLSQATCRLLSAKEMRALRQLLLDSHYTHGEIQSTLFGVIPTRTSSSSSAPDPYTVAGCPLYIVPAAAGTVGPAPATDTAQACLVALFLLGIAVPRSDLQRTLTAAGVELLLQAQLVYPCDVHPHLLLGYVSLTPLNWTRASTTTTLWLATDWHPRVLSTTSLSEDTDPLAAADTKGETVMYVGPDSLALVQHFLLAMDENDDVENSHHPVSHHPLSPDDLDQELHHSDDSVVALDLCCGSGIQGLVALAAGRASRVVAVDCNPRALHFMAWNAALNGLASPPGHHHVPEKDGHGYFPGSGRFTLVQGDLLAGMGSLYQAGDRHQPLPHIEPLLPLLRRLGRWPLGDGDDAADGGKFQFITANPPFLPVPTSLRGRRHGLFSSGGASGEDVLAAVVRLSSQCLDGRGGVLAVVSEFFLKESVDRPPFLSNVEPKAGRVASYSADLQVQRLEEYWTGSNASTSASGPSTSLGDPMRSSYGQATGATNCRGLLLTNEFPISASEYAQRRADSLPEFYCWQDHLKEQGIDAVSPGLLYIEKGSLRSDSAPNYHYARQDDPYHFRRDDDVVTIQHITVPKSTRGSLWTPSNVDAIQWTRSLLRQDGYLDFWSRQRGRE